MRRTGKFDLSVFLFLSAHPRGNMLSCIFTLPITYIKQATQNVAGRRAWRAARVGRAGSSGCGGALGLGTALLRQACGGLGRVAATHFGAVWCVTLRVSKLPAASRGSLEKWSRVQATSRFMGGARAASPKKLSDTLPLFPALLSMLDGLSAACTGRSCFSMSQRATMAAAFSSSH